MVRVAAYFEHILLPATWIHIVFAGPDPFHVGIRPQVVETGVLRDPESSLGYSWSAWIATPLFLLALHRRTHTQRLPRAERVESLKAASPSHLRM